MKKSWLAFAAALSLVACGGGGDDDEAAAPAAPGVTESISGFWDSEFAGLMVTAEGEVWGVEIDGVDLILYQGTVTPSGTSFSGNITAYLGAEKVPGTTAGSFIAGQSLNGSLSFPPDSGTYALTYTPGFDTAPVLSAAAGTYDLIGGGTVVVDDSGAYSALVNGCATTGQLTADASGKAFYRITSLEGAAPCAVPGRTSAGVLVVVGDDLIGGVVSGDVGLPVVAEKRAVVPLPPT